MAIIPEECCSGTPDVVEVGSGADVDDIVDREALGVAKAGMSFPLLKDVWGRQIESRLGLTEDQKFVEEGVSGSAIGTKQ